MNTCQIRAGTLPADHLGGAVESCIAISACGSPIHT
jgi:hypothetical protein